MPYGRSCRLLCFHAPFALSHEDARVWRKRGQHDLVDGQGAYCYSKYGYCRETDDYQVSTLGVKLI